MVEVGWRLMMTALGAVAITALMVLAANAMPSIVVTSQLIVWASAATIWIPVNEIMTGLGIVASAAAACWIIRIAGIGINTGTGGTISDITR